MASEAWAPSLCKVMKVQADAAPSTVPITIRPIRPRDIFIGTENCNEAAVLLAILLRVDESLNRKVES